MIQVTGLHHRGTPLIRLLARLGWQRDPEGWTVAREATYLIPAPVRPTGWELCQRNQTQRNQVAGDLARRTWMNSRIHSGWSGQARAETITPSTTAAPFTNCAPAAVTSGSSAG